MVTLQIRALTYPGGKVVARCPSLRHQVIFKFSFSEWYNPARSTSVTHPGAHWGFRQTSPAYGISSVLGTFRSKAGLKRDLGTS